MRVLGRRQDHLRPSLRPVEKLEKLFTCSFFGEWGGSKQEQGRKVNLLCSREAEGVLFFSSAYYCSYFFLGGWRTKDVKINFAFLCPFRELNRLLNRDSNGFQKAKAKPFARTYQDEQHAIVSPNIEIKRCPPPFRNIRRSLTPFSFEERGHSHPGPSRKSAELRASPSPKVDYLGRVPRGASRGAAEERREVSSRRVAMSRRSRMNSNSQIFMGLPYMLLHLDTLLSVKVVLLLGVDVELLAMVRNICTS